MVVPRTPASGGGNRCGNGHPLGAALWSAHRSGVWRTAGAHHPRENAVPTSLDIRLASGSLQALSEIDRMLRCE